MTGEVTLQGRVLAIGGLKEKLLAAKQHNVKTVLVPEENKDDLEEILKEIKLDELDVILVKTMDDVLKTAFIKNPLNNKPRPKRKTAKKKRASLKKKRVRA